MPRRGDQNVARPFDVDGPHPFQGRPPDADDAGGVKHDRAIRHGPAHDFRVAHVPLDELHGPAEQRMVRARRQRQHAHRRAAFEELLDKVITEKARTARHANGASRPERGFWGHDSLPPQRAAPRRHAASRSDKRRSSSRLWRTSSVSGALSWR